MVRQQRVEFLRDDYPLVEDGRQQGGPHR